MKGIRYLLVLPDGVGLRNFVCTRFIDLLLESGSVTLWHDLPSESIHDLEGQFERVTWQEMPPIRDRVAERFFRQAKILAQLYWQKKQGLDELEHRRHQVVRGKARFLQALARTVGRSCADRRRILWLDRMHQSFASRASHLAAYESYVAQRNPQVVFCTHQRALKAVPAMLAARRLRIPNATFIFSWDNLPKGRMPIAADHFLVWSEYMRAELLHYYPDVATERIHVVGTPQFENHKDESLIWSRMKFCEWVGLDPARPVVCFSGDDLATSPYDHIYLDDLARSVKSIAPPQRPQILFRRCPSDCSRRYEAILRAHQEIVVSDPLWCRSSNNEWSQVVPTKEDVGLLVNVISHSDVVVNFGSTMAMDFAVRNKPAIYIGYTPKQANGKWNHKSIYARPHFRTTHELQPVHWVHSPGDFATVVMEAILNPMAKADERGAWLKLHVQHPLEQASTRCVTTLHQLAVGQRSQGAAKNG
ncbi:MAG: glycosyltransferase [Acidobacteria bacterium]|nr:glycosyltransferase [Acidobacteriota bacterium]